MGTAGVETMSRAATVAAFISGAAHAGREEGQDQPHCAEGAQQILLAGSGHRVPGRREAQRNVPRGARRVHRAGWLLLVRAPPVWCARSVSWALPQRLAWGYRLVRTTSGKAGSKGIGRETWRCA